MFQETTNMQDQIKRNNLKILTYNMHGFNQGEEFIKCMNNLNTHDIIFIQKHGLGSDNINKFNRFSNFDFSGISAMAEATKCDVIHGRPAGGVSSQ